MTITDCDTAGISNKDLTVLLNDMKITEQQAEVDIEKIAKVLENVKLQKLLEVHNILQKPLQRDKKDDFVKLCTDVFDALKKDQKCVTCQELMKIMESPNFRCLIEAFENITNESYATQNVFPEEESPRKGPPLRVVGLTKNAGDPLGISLAKHADGCIYIQRIMRGTLVDKQGLFNVGDVIKEVNGEPVGDDPEKAYQQLSSKGSVTVKCIPAFKDMRGGKCQAYFRCHFDFSPNQYESFPKGEIGLSFQRGDILEVVDQSDPNWWQAKRHGDSTHVGVVPSLKFEQTRKASNLIPKEKESKVLGLFRKKGSKKRIMYQACKNSIFDCFDVRLYEEIVRMPTVENKVIILVGAQGVGKVALIARLHNSYPDRYVTVKPDTSRKPKEGELQKNGYNFLNKAEMQGDILAGKYFEWGETKGEFYGSKLSAIRDIINAGKTAIVECEPSALKLLRTAEFMPFIVFIEASSVQTLQTKSQDNSGKPKTKEELERIVRESKEIDETYHHYFDTRIPTGDINDTYNVLRKSIETHAEQTHQWVPISWVY